MVEIAEGGESPNALEDYRRVLIPIGDVPSITPTQVLPGLLVPGLNVLVGPPKSLKSTLVLHMAAAIVHGVDIDKFHKAPFTRGQVIYFAAEQSAGKLRNLYEKILGEPLEAGHNWNFAVARNPWEWKIDDRKPPPAHSLTDLIQTLKPSLTVLDPFIHFHNQDENDPHLVSFLQPLKTAAASYGGALLLVHHLRKNAPGARPDGVPDWDRVRGTSALWALADGGIQCRRMATGEGVSLSMSFKDFPEDTFTWYPRR